MQIIIDASFFAKFINNKQEHGPVYKCVCTGKGRVVIGGKKYGKELEDYPKFLKLIVEWDILRKVVKLDKVIVDKNEVILESIIEGKDFDDHHILSMVIHSGTEVVCALDNGIPRLIDACYSDTGRRMIKKYCCNLRKLKRPGVYKGKQHLAMLV